MKALLLAAGRGERMKPLTDTTPKPLLCVRGRPLIAWHVVNLVRAGITDIVINHAWLGEQIEQVLGDGSQFGASIRYSPEGTARETAGAVALARPLLGEEPFLAVSTDIYCPHFDFSDVLDVLPDHDVLGHAYTPAQRDIAWLYLTPPPPFHPKGDFGLRHYTLTNQGNDQDNTMWNFANIGVYRMEMFDSIPAGQHAPLGPLIRQFVEAGRVGGEIYRGPWFNVGTPEQLAELNRPLKPVAL